MNLRAIIALALLFNAPCSLDTSDPIQTSEDGTVWAVAPDEPGPNEPPAGRSLFDEVFSQAVNGERVYDLPFPFEKLTARIASEVGDTRDLNVRQVLIPIGRSLQRSSNHPNYFASPRVVVAVDGEPPLSAEPPLYLKDRLFLGYQAKVGVIEVISYNEQAGRFEFQIVSDYQSGREPQVRLADRRVCIACHQGLAPIFPRPLWNETNANRDVRALLAEHGSEFFGVPVEQGVDIPQLIDQSTDRASLFAAYQLVWSKGCPDDRCRADALFAIFAYRLNGHRHIAEPEQERFATALAASWAKHWPQGLKIPNPDIPDRDIIGNLKRTSQRAGQPDLIQRAGSAEFASFIDRAFHNEVYEPRTPRQPIEVWRPGDIRLEFAQNVISGLAAFFSESDIHRVRESLGNQSGTESYARLRPVIEEMAHRGSDALSAKPLRPSTVVATLTQGLVKQTSRP